MALILVAMLGALFYIARLLWVIAYNQAEQVKQAGILNNRIIEFWRTEIARSRT